MSPSPKRQAFAVPGDPATPTGGYLYDTRVMAASRGVLTPLRLPDGFPDPTDSELAVARAELMAAGPVLIDGLAYGALPAGMIAALPHAPVALCHHPLALEPGIGEATAKRLFETERAALALAAHVIVTSDATKRVLVADFAVPADKVTVAPPGLDHAPRAVGTIPPTLLTVASLTPRKGHDVLVSALVQIAHLDWRAVWVGPDDRNIEWAGQMRRQIADAGLTHRITITGAVDGDALAARYADADIFVLPSRFEGYGMVFDEAMMRGLPVIACEAGAARDVVPPDAGTLVPVNDNKALSDVIMTILEDHPRRAAMADAARAHALTLPTWDDTWAKIKPVLEAS